MKKSVLIILETSDIGCRYTADAARELGLEPLFLADLQGYQADTLKQLHDERVIDTKTTNASELHKIVSSLKIETIAGVVTFLDSRLRIATELARLLGGRGHDQACDLLKDKSYVQALLPEYSPASIQLSDMTSDSDLKRFMRSSQATSFVLKPTDTAGAIGYREFSRDEIAFSTIETHLRASNIGEHLRPDSWILQEKIQGQLASMEGFVTAGAIHWLGASGREKVGNTESRINFPCESELHPLGWITAKEAIQALIERSGFSNGYFHIEFIFTGPDAYLIDANMGRLGGGPIGELLADAYSINVTSVYRHVITTTLGMQDISPYRMNAPILDVLGVCYGISDGGRLENLEMNADLNVNHTQIIDTGMDVTPMGTNNWAWIGILSGKRDNVMSILRHARIRTSEGLREACF